MSPEAALCSRKRPDRGPFRRGLRCRRLTGRLRQDPAGRPCARGPEDGAVRRRADWPAGRCRRTGAARHLQGARRRSRTRRCPQDHRLSSPPPGMWSPQPGTGPIRAAKVVSVATAVELGGAGLVEGIRTTPYSDTLRSFAGPVSGWIFGEGTDPR